MEINNIIDIGNHVSVIITSVILAFAGLTLVSIFNYLYTLKKCKRTNDTENKKSESAISFVRTTSRLFLMLTIAGIIISNGVQDKKHEAVVDAIENYLGEQICSDLSDKDIENFLYRGEYLEIYTEKDIKIRDSSNNHENSSDMSNNVENSTLEDNSETLSTSEMVGSTEVSTNSLNEDNDVVNGSTSFTDSDNNNVASDDSNSVIEDGNSKNSSEDTESSNETNSDNSSENSEDVKTQTIKNHYIICNKGNYIEFYKELYENYFQKVYKED